MDVLDLTDDVWKMAMKGNLPFLARDTHWTPQAMRFAADALSNEVRPHLGDYAREDFSTAPYRWSNEGDLVDLMGDKGDTNKWPPENLELTGLLHNGQPVQAGDESTVLLLGDSYSQIYADPDRVPTPAGLPQQLMLNLGCKVQSIIGYGKRFSRGRQILAEQPETLRRKKVVIWQFTSRVLPDALVSLPAP